MVKMVITLPCHGKVTGSSPDRVAKFPCLYVSGVKKVVAHRDISSQYGEPWLGGRGASPFYSKDKIL